MTSGAVVQCAVFAVVAGALVVPAGAAFWARVLGWTSSVLFTHSAGLKAAYNSYCAEWRRPDAALTARGGVVITATTPQS